MPLERVPGHKIGFSQCWNTGIVKLIRERYLGSLLTDLSKVFDCLLHELIIAKLNAYGSSLSALKLAQNYMSKRHRSTKINQSCSSWEEILFGVLQGSRLGPILFNIFFSGPFLIIKDVNIASYPDDNTIYQSGNNVDDVINGAKYSRMDPIKFVKAAFKRI